MLRKLFLALLLALPIFAQNSLNTPSVGGKNVLGVALEDQANASGLNSLLTMSDARNLSGLYGLLTQNVGMLLNTGGNYDQARSAPGTTGIPSVNIEGTKATYSVAVIGFTPAATATDFWNITGSGTKTVRVLYLRVSGTATSASTSDLQLIKRTTANTGGTPTTATLGQNDSNDAAPTAVVSTYGANPTTGSAAGVLRAVKMNLAAAAGPQVYLTWDFTTHNDKGLVLRGTGQSLNLNWNGAAVPAGTSLDIEVEWTEE